MTQADVVWRIPSDYNCMYLASLIGDYFINQHCIQNIESCFEAFWSKHKRYNNINNSIDKIVVIKYTVCKRFKCLKNLNFFYKNLINLGTSIYVQVNRSLPKLQVYWNHSCFRNFEFRTSISTSVLLCLLPTHPWKVISLVLTSGVF